MPRSVVPTIWVLFDDNLTGSCKIQLRGRLPICKEILISAWKSLWPVINKNRLTYAARLSTGMIVKHHRVLSASPAYYLAKAFIGRHLSKASDVVSPRLTLKAVRYRSNASSTSQHIQTLPAPAQLWPQRILVRRCQLHHA